MQKTKLVGILNLTPDSFSNDGIFNDTDLAVTTAKKMFDDGADFLDIGAESTRPGAIAISPNKEYDRLASVLERIVYLFQGKIYLDSYHPETVYRVIERFGKVILNDVTGMVNPSMVEIALKYNLNCVVSHFPAIFGQNIQAAHLSKNLINDEQTVLNELLNKRQELEEKGISRECIILDPGIGFGKTAELNKKLLSFARLIPDSEIMIGYSRKRFLGEDRMSLQTNLKACDLAVDNGASYLRVHDVSGHAQHLYERFSSLRTD